MSKNRNHIDAHVLATAAKWAKPKLRKKYTFKPKATTVAKYLRDSKDVKLQRQYAQYMKRSKLKTKSAENRSTDKVYDKFESKNNFQNLKSSNIEFAINKNKKRKEKSLKRLDSLAWESIAIPSDDRIFGCLDDDGNKALNNGACGVGQLEVIDSKTFFQNYDKNDLKIEEYVLDNDNLPSARSYDDSIGLKKKLDPMSFKNEAAELIKLVQVSLHKINPSKSPLIAKSDLMQLQQQQQTNGNEKGKKLKKRKTMKQRANEKKLIALQRKFSDESLLKTQQQINKELLRLLQINVSQNQIELKMKAKTKWKNGKRKKLQFMMNEPAIKKRKLNGSKKGKFREQISNLHNKQNIDIITQNWNALLMNKDQSKNDSFCNNSRELLSHLDTSSYDLGNNGNNNVQKNQNCEFHPVLLRGLADLGFDHATNIQKEVIPLAMNGDNDCLIAAATGSGKTLSFGIPILNDLLLNELNLLHYVYGLIVTPTRELAIQIEAHLNGLLKYSTIRCVSIIGGMSFEKQRRLLRSSPEVIIATPGRIWQLMQDKESLHLRDLTHLRYLVLDEADKLLSSSHFQEVEYILSTIKTIWTINDCKQHFDASTKEEEENEQENEVYDEENNYNLMGFLEESDSKGSDDEDYKEMEDEDVDIKMTENQNKKSEKNKVEKEEISYRRQTFIVSATLTLESINRSKTTESKIPIFANLATMVPFGESIKMIDQTPRHRTTSNVKEYEVPITATDKDAMCCYLLQAHSGRTLVFSNTIGTVKRLTLILKELGFNAFALHSQQQQRQRLKNMDKFVNNKRCVLICTDVCARGLDIPSVDNVIHFQCPTSAEDYIHRSGRVGRREMRQNEHEEMKVKVDGHSFLLMTAEDNKVYNKIILALKRPSGLERLAINERLLVQIKRQVSICKKIASLVDENRRHHRKKTNLQKMADAAGIELDEINCKALGIMKTNMNQRGNKSSKKRRVQKNGKHATFEYGVDADGGVHQQVKQLRFELKQMKSQNDFKRAKSSYLTKTFL